MLSSGSLLRGAESDERECDAETYDVERRFEVLEQRGKKAQLSWLM
jgi:hypothetical protein